MDVVKNNAIDDNFIERFAQSYPLSILETLLCDRTTGRNIIWADNEYEALGDGYFGDDEITVEKITGKNAGVIRPRIAKRLEQRSQRTKSRAEVFSPSWLCNRMNNDLDEAWFGRRNVFNVEGDQSWKTRSEPVEFPKNKKGHGWHAYVEAAKLEITCGEAPFVCSRYDAVTGDKLPVHERVGFLDRKLRIVSEKTKTRKEWVCRAIDALHASYGFEYQGDNLLIARINVFETFVEHYRNLWDDALTPEELGQAAWIVSWNFWQMNGLTDAVPTNKMGIEIESTLKTFEEPEPQPIQPSLFDLFDDVFPDETTEEVNEEEGPKEKVPLCVIYDWQSGEPFEFASLKGKASAMGKKFYAVIGNPPYQLSYGGSESGNKTYAPPIYHEFMDAAFKAADKVELITPARFLFDAGSTPKMWNKKMLNDKHFKVLDYRADASSAFSNTDIKGGVAVTYRDAKRSYGPIGIFTAFPELTSLNKKVNSSIGINSLSSIIYTQTRFALNALYADYPELEKVIGSNGKDRRFRNNIFDRVSVFREQPFEDSIKVLGIQKNRRTYKYIDSGYVDFSHECLSHWKVLVPAANGSGALGEVLSSPLVAPPRLGYTQSFIAIGSFDDESEANACLRYIKTKFVRVLLGILKTTQHNDRGVWKYVPLQDFTSNSDIDWSQSIADIDKQLYAKYGLDDDEIAFIESHVKEMK